MKQVHPRRTNRKPSTPEASAAPDKINWAPPTADQLRWPRKGQSSEFELMVAEGLMLAVYSVVSGEYDTALKLIMRVGDRIFDEQKSLKRSKAVAQ